MLLNSAFSLIVCIFLFKLSSAQDCSNRKEGSLLAHPFECSFFYRCSNDSSRPALLEKCPRGFYFDERSGKEKCTEYHSHCTSSIQVDLVYLGSKFKEIKPMDIGKSSSLLSPPHPQDYYQLKKDSFDCNRFYKNGILYACPYYMQFDTILETCVPVKSCPCQKLPQITCGKNQDNFLADPLDCHRFWRCFNGHLFEFKCNNELYFDPGLGVCNYKQYVECNRC